MVSRSARILAARWAVIYGVVLGSLLIYLNNKIGVPNIDNTLGSVFGGQIPIVGTWPRYWDVLLVPIFWYTTQMILQSKSQDERWTTMTGAMVLTLLFTFTGVVIAIVMVVAICVILIGVPIIIDKVVKPLCDILSGKDLE